MSDTHPPSGGAADERPWIGFVVRDLDKPAILDASGAPISDGAWHLLLVLSMYKTGSCYPSEARLARHLGTTVRTVRRHLGVLRGRGLIEIARGRHHATSVYVLREDALSSLPSIESGPYVRPEGPRPDSTDIPDRTNETSQTGHHVLQRSSLEDQKEEEAVDVPPLPLREAFEIARDEAQKHQRATPMTGARSREALLALVDEAKRAGWPSVSDGLRARLRLHYSRDEAFLADRGYALTMARQVPQPPPPRRPRPIPPLVRAPEQRQCTREENIAFATAAVEMLQGLERGAARP